MFGLRGYVKVESLAAKFIKEIDGVTSINEKIIDDNPDTMSYGISFVYEEILFSCFYTETPSKNGDKLSGVNIRARYGFHLKKEKKKSTIIEDINKFNNETLGCKAVFSSIKNKELTVKFNVEPWVLTESINANFFLLNLDILMHSVGAYKRDMSYIK